MRIDLKVPEKWSDLTLDQLKVVAETLSRCLSKEEALALLLYRLTGMVQDPSTGETVTVEGVRFRMQPRQLAAIAKRLEWVWNTPSEGCPNPSKKDRYLRDMTFGDWFECDTQMRLYIQDADPGHFNAILRKLGEDPRKTEPWERTMYLLWWQGVQATIAPMYPNVFEKSEGASGYNPFKAIQDMHLLLNDDRPQDNAAIDDSNLHDALAALDSRISKIKAKQEDLNNTNR